MNYAWFLVSSNGWLFNCMCVRICGRLKINNRLKQKRVDGFECFEYSETYWMTMPFSPSFSPFISIHGIWYGPVQSQFLRTTFYHVSGPMKNRSSIFRSNNLTETTTFIFFATFSSSNVFVCMILEYRIYIGLFAYCRFQPQPNFWENVERLHITCVRGMCSVHAPMDQPIQSCIDFCLFFHKSREYQHTICGAVEHLRVRATQKADYCY